MEGKQKRRDAEIYPNGDEFMIRARWANNSWLFVPGPCAEAGIDESLMTLFNSTKISLFYRRNSADTSTVDNFIS